MSFRELRNFTEMMRALGYPRLISMENFRNPNFALVHDILIWLAHRYDPSADIPTSVRTEDQRVQFLQATCQVLASSARVTLSSKKLYRADGFAVRELLKVAEQLYRAMLTGDNEDVLDNSAEEKTEEPVNTDDIDLHGSSSTKLAEITLGVKLDEVEGARKLSSSIIDAGSKIHELLSKEMQLRSVREDALAFVDSLSMHLDRDDPHKQVAKAVRQQLVVLEEELQHYEGKTEQLQKERTNLTQALQKKTHQLSRVEKRIRSWKHVRPQYMDDFEKLEEELVTTFSSYTRKYRNLSYLQAEIEKYRRAENLSKQESQQALKDMQRRLKQQEMAILRGDVYGGEGRWSSQRQRDSEDSDLLTGSDEDSDPPMGRSRGAENVYGRPSAAGRHRAGERGENEAFKRRMQFGGSGGGGEDDVGDLVDTSDDSLGTDSELDMKGGDGMGEGDDTSDGSMDDLSESPDDEL